MFGSPSDTGTWGYRVEGHHLSQNYTVVHGEVVNGPSFFGCNPADIRQGSRKGLRTLAREDDLGIELIRSLDEQQQKVAIVEPTAYEEILTAASRKTALAGQPSGLSAAKMNAKQFDTLVALMEEYARNVPDELAEQRMAQINKAVRNIYFAWSGGISSGDPRYYRVQTPSFLIEFDDTQDKANHIRFLAALDGNQRGKATFPFDADERMNWHFIPNNIRVSFDSLGDRKGLPLREKSPDQKHLASALLAAGLSRTGYIKAVTDQAGAPFRETIRKIEAGEPPFVDTRDLEHDDVSEPYFLEECEEAAESIEVIGHWCLCMVYASLKAYLDRFINSIARNFRNGSQLQQLLAGKKAKSWFERYRLLFVEDLGIDWHKGPVKLSELEHLNLARHDVTHNVDVTSMYVHQTERHAKRYPKGLFVDDVWLNLNLGGRIKVGRDELTAVLRMVGDFCTWLEDIRIHYPARIKTAETPDKES